VKKKPSFGSSFFGAFLLTASIRRRRMLDYIYFSQFSDEFIMDDNAAAVKNSCKLYQQIPGNV
jgi:hypothetical protein